MSRSEFKEQLREAALLPPELTPEQKEKAQESFEAKFPEVSERAQLPLSDLIPSTSNLRKKFTGIEQLAAALKSVGMLQPMLVRPHPTKKGKFEIVAGGRRYLAAKEAGFKTVPVEIRAITDAQLDEGMLVENIQREDLHPMEEAEGYRRLKEDHHYKEAQIAAKIGRPIAHVYGLLKLLALGPEGRKAFMDGRIDKTVAIALARIRSHKVQAGAIPDVLKAKSAAEALKFLTEEHCTTLKSAPFDQKDKELIPEVGACTKCPYRSGGTPGLFEDISGHDTCTNVPCYDAKVSASWDRASEAAEKKKWTVLTVAAGKTQFAHGNKLSNTSPYVLASAPADGDPKKRTWKQLTAKLEQPITTFFIPDRNLKGWECFKREEALALLSEGQKWAAKELAADVKAPGGAASAPVERDYDKERRERDVRELVLAKVVEQASAEVTKLGAPELRLISLVLHRELKSELALSKRGLTDATAEAWITEKSEKDLTSFIYEAALSCYLGGTWQGYSPEAQALIKRLKFPVEAEEKALGEKLEAEALMKKPKDAEPEEAVGEEVPT